MKAFLPEKLPIKNLDFGKLINLVGEANRMLSLYNGTLRVMINPHILLAPLKTKEAILSSRIEGTQISLTELMQYEAGEKYDDIVRVVSITDGKTCISKEFCAGTHARNIRDLRLVKIVSEGAIAAGTRRIELVVSKSAFEFMNAKVKEIDKLSLMFKVHYDGVVERIEKLLDENKELQKELTQAKEENARAKFATFLSKAQDIEGGKLFISKVESFDGNTLKAGLEYMSQKLGESIIVLASERTVAVKVSDSFVKKGVNAGKIVGEIARATGANGGGRPNFAQGGVKDASKLDEILAKVEDELKY